MVLVTFGVGTKAANLRYDENQICVQVYCGAIVTGRRKFDVVGNWLKTRINTRVNAGMTLETDARTKRGRGSGKR